MTTDEPFNNAIALMNKLMDEVEALLKNMSVGKDKQNSYLIRSKNVMYDVLALCKLKSRLSYAF